MKTMGKRKKKIRFFNRPVKIGVGIAGIGASIEFGKTDIYTLIQDPNLIFWLEVIKYATIILGTIFASGGVIKQAREDLKSIKVGEKVKEIVTKDEDLKESSADTFEAEHENKSSGLEEVFKLGKDLFKSRRKNK